MEWLHCNLRQRWHWISRALLHRATPPRDRAELQQRQWHGHPDARVPQETVPDTYVTWLAYTDTFSTVALSLLTPRIYAFRPCGHFEFESGIPHNVTNSRRFSQLVLQRNYIHTASILTDRFVRCIFRDLNCAQKAELTVEMNIDFSPGLWSWWPTEVTSNPYFCIVHHYTQCSNIIRLGGRWRELPKCRRHAHRRCYASNYFKNFKQFKRIYMGNVTCGSETSNVCMFLRFFHTKLPPNEQPKPRVMQALTSHWLSTNRRVSGRTPWRNSIRTSSRNSLGNSPSHKTRLMLALCSTVRTPNSWINSKT